MDELEKLDEFEQLENMVASEDNQPITMQDLMEDSVMSLSDHEPVQSKILNKYFPSQIKRLQELNDRQEDDSHQEIQEISRLKISNQKLKKENEDKDRQHKRLKKEQEEFESYKKAEMDRIQQLHLENVKSLKRERQLERQEMELLRAQLREQAEGFKSKETRMQSTQERLRKKIQDLETKNRELQDEIKTLEKERARFVERHAAEKPILKKPPLREVRESTMLKTQEELKHADGKRERIYPDGTKLVRLVSTDGTVEYWYSEPKIRHLTYPNGEQLLEFSNGQVERRYQDGTQEILFVDKTEQITFPDGMVKRVQQGKRTITYPDGTVEVHDHGIRTKTYPDGLLKRVFEDGSQEVIWPDGRVRRKNANGVPVS
ncbi:T-complex protein 10 C-terminus-domain-containing protein [Gorgonomyces haynaldii]|nr:T-complex protein 10 C-terminus-domain-containing protein [Gorgonomyces haynaldii]